MPDPEPSVTVEWELGYLAAGVSNRSVHDGLPDGSWRNPYRVGTKQHGDYTAGMMSYCREAALPDDFRW